MRLTCATLAKSFQPLLNLNASFSPQLLAVGHFPGEQKDGYGLRHLVHGADARYLVGRSLATPGVYQRLCGLRRNGCRALAGIFPR